MWTEGPNALKCEFIKISGYLWGGSIILNYWLSHEYNLFCFSVTGDIQVNAVNFCYLFLLIFVTIEGKLFCWLCSPFSKLWFIALAETLQYICIMYIYILCITIWKYESNCICTPIYALCLSTMNSSLYFTCASPWKQNPCQLMSKSWFYFVDNFALTL